MTLSRSSVERFRIYQFLVTFLFLVQHCIAKLGEKKEGYPFMLFLYCLFVSTCKIKKEKQSKFRDCQICHCLMLQHEFIEN